MTMQTQTAPPMGADAPLFAPGKLVRGVHDQMAHEIQRISHEVGVSVEDITGARNYLTAFEKDYLLGFRTLSKAGELGLIYVGAHDPSVLDRQRSVCGALTRNFLEARFMTREELVSLLFADRRVPNVSLIAIPDFHYEDAPVSTKRALASFLVGRAARQKQTVIGVPNKGVLNSLFQDDTDLYLKHFRVLQGVVQK